MKRTQSMALLRFVSSSLRLSLAAGVVGVFASAGFAAGTSTDTYYVNDHLASTVATSDAAGEIAQIESDAFGTQEGAVAKDSRFTGKPYDADMGAYVFPFRNYRSDEARWMSADPSGFPDGVNAIAYMACPNISIDATGLAVVINSLVDALNYYSSGAGGTVTAGAGLISDIKSCSDYTSMKTALGTTLNTKLSAVSQGLNTGTITGTGTRSLANTGIVLGGIILNLSYSGVWNGSTWASVSGGGANRNVTASPVYSFSFSDPWDFTPNSTYSALKNLFGETIPGVIADAYSYATTASGGKAFTITGSFTDTISGSAIQHRE